MGPDLAEGIILARDFALIFHRMMVTLRGNRSRCAPAQVQTRECHVAPPALFRRSNDIQPNARGFQHWHILWAARLHCVPNGGSGVGVERSSRTWHLHLLHHRCLRRSRCGEAVEQEEDECFGVARCPPSLNFKFGSYFPNRVLSGAPSTFFCRSY